MAGQGLATGLAQGQSIKVKTLGGRSCPTPVSEGEGVGGQAGPRLANRSEEFCGYSQIHIQKVGKHVSV